MMCDVHKMKRVWKKLIQSDKHLTKSHRLVSKLEKYRYENLSDT